MHAVYIPPRERMVVSLWASSGHDEPATSPSLIKDNQQNANQGHDFSNTPSQGWPQ